MNKTILQKSWVTLVKEYLLITLGVTMYALGWAMFLTPNNMIGGGVTGFAAILEYAFKLPIPITYFVLNILLLVIGTKILGTGFGAKTIYAIIMTSVMLAVTKELIPVDFVAEFSQDSKIVCTVLGGIMAGVGIGLSMSQGGSTGGTDIIAAIVNKYKTMSLGSVIMACDVVIISSCYFIFHDWFRVIYGFVMLFICSTTIDYWMRRRHQSVQFMIFSRNPDAIADAIVKMHHGVTMLDGQGWFTHTDRKVIVSVVRRREQFMMQRMIKSIDPYAFVSMTDASGVWGEGFDQIKVTAKKKKEDKNKKNAVLVCVTNNTIKIDTAQTALGEYYDIRSLLQVGCDTRKEFYSVVLGQEPRKRVAFIKKFFGFDAFYLAKDGTATLVQGNYDQAEYDITQHENLEAMRKYLEEKKRKKR